MHVVVILLLECCMCDHCGCDTNQTPCDACSMMQAAETQRREFETWMRENTTATLSREGQNYRVYEVDIAWRAWTAARAEAKRLRGLLISIAEYAHDNSQGPEIPDVLWTIRQMAYEIPTQAK